MKKLWFVFTIFSLLAVSCSRPPGGDAQLVDASGGTRTNAPASISALEIQGSRLIIHGKNLNGVTAVTGKDKQGSPVSFEIASKSFTRLEVKNITAGFSLILKEMYSLIVSDAYGTGEFPVMVKLNHPGANDGDVLVWNATTGDWDPTALNGLNFQGTFDASLGSEPAIGNSGDFYVVSTGGTVTLTVLGSTVFSAGDWILYDSVAGGWTRVATGGGATVTSFNGRNGDVTPAEGDYVLDNMGDVSASGLSGSDTGKVLKWDGSTWRAQPEAGGAITSIGDIADVSVAAPASGDLLVWDGANWTNSPLLFDNTSVGVNGSSEIEVKDTGITTAKLADGSVTAVKLDDDAVDSTKIKDGSIATADIENSAITTAKIATGAVDSTKLATDAVETSRIANGAVTSAKIEDGSITTSDLGANSVTSAKILDGNVTSAKIADGTIATVDLANNSVTVAKLANCGANEILKADGSGVMGCAADGGGSDNLGNHTATAHLDMGGYAIENLSLFQLVDKGSDSKQWSAQEGAGDNNFHLINNASTKMLVTTTGEVGIGTNSPAEKLHVAGTIKADTDVCVGATCLTTVTSNNYADGSTIKAADGTLATPSITFNSDTDSGLYKVGANEVGFVSGGTEQFRMLSTGETEFYAPLEMDNNQELRLKEQDGQGDHHVALKTISNLAASYTLTLPVDDGNNGEILRTDGSGVLSWVDPSASSKWTFDNNMITPSVAANSLAVGSNLTYDSTKNHNYILGDDINMTNNNGNGNILLGHGIEFGDDVNNSFFFNSDDTYTNLLITPSVAGAFDNTFIVRAEGGISMATSWNLDQFEVLENGLIRMGGDDPNTNYTMIIDGSANKQVMVGRSSPVAGAQLSVEGDIKVPSGSDICIDGVYCLSAAVSGSSKWSVADAALSPNTGGVNGLAVGDSLTYGGANNFIFGKNNVIADEITDNTGNFVFGENNQINDDLADAGAPDVLKRNVIFGRDNRIDADGADNNYMFGTELVIGGDNAHSNYLFGHNIEIEHNGHDFNGNFVFQSTSTDPSHVKFDLSNGSKDTFFVKTIGGISLTAKPGNVFDQFQISNTGKIFFEGDGNNTNYAMQIHPSGTGGVKPIIMGGDTQIGDSKLTVQGNIRVDAGSDICIDGGNCLSGAGGGGGAFSTTANVTSSGDADDDFVFGSTQLDDAADPNKDGRMFFDKSKAAFRAGYVTTVEWDDANVGQTSVVSGGYNNTASGNNSSVGGGHSNTAQANYSSIAGGSTNTASGMNSSILGGYSNNASGAYSSVLGGQYNEAAGDYSVVAGNRAKNSTVTHDGVFMFADSNAVDLVSTNSNQFLARATNGFSFGVNTTMDDGLFIDNTGIVTITPANPAGNALVLNGDLYVDGQLSFSGGAQADIEVDDVKVQDELQIFNHSGSALWFLTESDDDYTDSLRFSVGDDSQANEKVRFQTDGKIYVAPGGDFCIEGGDCLTGLGGGGAFEETGSVIHQGNSPAFDEDFVFGSTQLADTTDIAHDARMFFDKSKAAFRAGEASGAEWDDPSIGNRSFAVGLNNQAAGANSSVLGGNGNNIGSSASSSSIIGGDLNTVTGNHSTVLGGASNTAAGTYSIVGGRHAKNTSPTHHGVFMFADANIFDFNSSTSNEFAIRSTGGVRLVTAIDGGGVPTKTLTIDSAGNLDADGNVCDGSGNCLHNPPPGDNDQSMDTFLNADNDGNGSGAVVMKINGTEHMRVDNDGDVGIGTIAPAAKLHVVGDTKLQTENSEIIINDNGDAVGAFKVVDDTSDVIKYDTATDVLELRGLERASVFSNKELRVYADADNNAAPSDALFIVQKGAAEIFGVDASHNVHIDSGDLLLENSSGFVGIAAPATINTDYTVTLPPDPPAANKYLKYNGASYVWADAGGASVWNAASNALAPAIGTNTTLKIGGPVVSGGMNRVLAFGDNTVQISNHNNIALGSYISHSRTGTFSYSTGFSAAMDPGANNKFSIRASGGINLSPDQAMQKGVFIRGAAETYYVGIGREVPHAMLDVAGKMRVEEICDETGGNCFDMSVPDPNILVHDATGSGTIKVDGGLTYETFVIGTDDFENAGVKMGFIKDKMAFRAGEDTIGSFWNSTTVGNLSVAFGQNTKASGIGSFAMGYGTIASGLRSIATGTSNTASVNNASAFGTSNTASGSSSFVVGNGNTAGGTNSLVGGSGANATGTNTLAFGESVQATQTGSIALGKNVVSDDIGSFIFGDNSLAGPFYTVRPNEFVAIAHGGHRFFADAATSKGLFIEGNAGTAGHVGINLENPTRELDVNGDIRWRTQLCDAGNSCITNFADLPGGSDNSSTGSVTFWSDNDEVAGTDGGFLFKNHSGGEKLLELTDGSHLVFKDHASDGDTDSFAFREGSDGKLNLGSYSTGNVYTKEFWFTKDGDLELNGHIWTDELFFHDVSGDSKKWKFDENTANGNFQLRLENSPYNGSSYVFTAQEFDVTTGAPIFPSLSSYDCVGTDASGTLISRDCGKFHSSGTVISAGGASDDFVFGSYQLADTATGNEDARMFFDNSKAAFRVGKVSSGQWDDAIVGNYSTVTGGYNNQAFGDYTTISGGHNNDISSGANYATVGGGFNNTSAQQYSTVAGGKSNTAGGLYASVGGGRNNNVSNSEAVIAGGASNTVTSSNGAILGGSGNNVSGGSAVISGGTNNTASGSASAVGGGSQNSAGGNTSFIAGGFQNTADGVYSAILGGSNNNTSGMYSVASGRRAKANHNGVFIFADSTDADYTSQANNEFKARATGGFSLEVDPGLFYGLYINDFGQTSIGTTTPGAYDSSTSF